MTRRLETRYLLEQISKYELRLRFQNAAIARIEKTEIGMAIETAKYLHAAIERKLFHLNRQRNEFENTPAAL